jgi:hypothetical protein
LIRFFAAFAEFSFSFISPLRHAISLYQLERYFASHIEYYCIDAILNITILLPDFAFFTLFAMPLLRRH